MTFNLFESFFLMSLGITFSLILIIFYHFKERIRFIENKTDNLFSLIQDLAEELKKPQYEKLNSGSPHNMLNQMEEEEPIYNNGMLLANQVLTGTDITPFQMNLEEELSEFDDSEDEGEDESEDESEDEGEDEGENEGENEGEDEGEDEGDNFDKITIPDIKIVKQDEPPKRHINIKKMNVGELRNIVIESQLCDDPSKMKKGELIELLQQNM